MDSLFDRLSRERGIGKKLATGLIDRFGPDLPAMAAATREQILQISGVGPSRVSAVLEALHLLSELSGPPLKIALDDGPPLRLQMPVVSVVSPDRVRVVGFGFDTVVNLGETVSVECLWDGAEVDDEGCPVLRWEAVK